MRGALATLLCLVCSCGRLNIDPQPGSGGADDGGSSTDSGEPSDDARPACSTFNGQVMYLSFDEGVGIFVTDRSAGGHNAALSGGPMWAPGRFGSGMLFDGNNDELSSIETPATLDDLGALTACVWSNIIDAPTQFFAYFDKALPGDTQGWNFYGNSDGRIGIFANTGAYREADGATFGVWHHVCGTWDGTLGENGLHLYIDGVEPGSAASAEGGAVQSDVGQDLKIGNSTMNGENAFHGTLDDVRLFDRALSASEVAALAACEP